MPGPEARIQKAVVDWARREFPKKMIVRKFQAGPYGTNGWPDYEFLIEGGLCFHIEFKAPGGKCTELQLARHEELRAIGHKVFVCDSADQAKGVVRSEMAPAAHKRVQGNRGGLRWRPT
jgi:hypothetical protein